MPKLSVRISTGSENSIRVDAYIANLGILSRSQFKTRSLKIFCNGKEIKPSAKADDGMILDLEWTDPPEIDLNPENIPLGIIYEDESVIVVNKQQGLVVHPGNGNYTGTMVHGLLYYAEEIAEEFPEDDFRPGIVHRLDKDTSGVIVVAKSPESHEFLSNQFRDKKVRKEYMAIVTGRLPGKEGIISGTIARNSVDRKRFAVSDGRGKTAETRYSVKKIWNGKYALVHLYPSTGRTHQLRVHMKHLKCPILGDPVYGKKNKDFPKATLMLHALNLSIVLPSTGELKTFSAPIPERFREIESELDKLYYSSS